VNQFDVGCWTLDVLAEIKSAAHFEKFRLADDFYAGFYALTSS
jgi:hypothetical protein